MFKVVINMVAGIVGKAGGSDSADGTDRRQRHASGTGRLTFTVRRIWCSCALFAAAPTSKSYVNDKMPEDLWPVIVCDTIECSVYKVFVIWRRALAFDRATQWILTVNFVNRQYDLSLFTLRSGDWSRYITAASCLSRGIFHFLIYIIKKHYRKVGTKVTST